MENQSVIHNLTAIKTAEETAVCTHLKTHSRVSELIYSCDRKSSVVHVTFGQLSTLDSFYLFPFFLIDLQTCRKCFVKTVPGQRDALCHRCLCSRFSSMSRPYGVTFPANGWFILLPHILFFYSYTILSGSNIIKSVWLQTLWLLLKAFNLFARNVHVRTVWMPTWI